MKPACSNLPVTLSGPTLEEQIKAAILETDR